MRYLWLFAVLALIVSCKEDKDPAEERRKQATIDEQIISDYLTDNNITANRLEVDYNSAEYGLYYIITQEGSGASPDYFSTVSVKYAGYLLDGTRFDYSDVVVTFSLQGVIPGWTFGVPLMRPGGKARFFIPSGLGYGPTGSGTIPENAVLIFDITLVNHY